MTLVNSALSVTPAEPVRSSPGLSMKAKPAIVRFAVARALDDGAGKKIEVGYFDIGARGFLLGGVEQARTGRRRGATWGCPTPLS